MSMNERTGTRDLLYSTWHRPASVRRFLSPRVTALITVIDIDWCEYCNWCCKPVALLETQESGRAPKSAKVTAQLAEMADLSAWSVSYERTSDNQDIGLFRVRQIYPASDEVLDLKPAIYAKFLWSLRRTHENMSPLCAAKTARVEIEEDLEPS